MSNDPLKRLFDVTLAASGLVTLAPVLGLAALAVKLSSRGPVLYRARRAGLGGEPFDVLKLRTMVAGADRGGTITAGRDPRVTRVGRVLRRTRLDELPQLWNILRGEMSLVGPRPESWNIVEAHWTEKERRLLTIRPGLTSPGTLYTAVFQEHLEPPPGMGPEAFYVRELMAPKLAYDRHYLRHRSPGYDLRLLWDTASVMLRKLLGLEPRWRPPDLS